jgi:hypothetical protein
MERSHRVPAWALWNPDSDDALIEYYAAVDTGKRPDLDMIVAAVASAPRSGLLLLELANRYALDDNLVDSFAMNLRAVTLYPRWPVARYRLAATAVMLANGNASRWRSSPQPARDSITAALRRCGLPSAEDLAETLETGQGNGQRVELCSFASGLIDPKKNVAVRRVLWRSLRPTERSYWFSLFRTREHVSFRTQFAELSKSARTIANVRETGNAVDLIAPQNDANLTWQLAYNLACAFAERAAHPVSANAQAADIKKALNLLELAAIRPGGHQLTREWLEHDPDLAVLRTDPRFERLANQLPQKEK